VRDSKAVKVPRLVETIGRKFSILFSGAGESESRNLQWWIGTEQRPALSLRKTIEGELTVIQSDWKVNRPGPRLEIEILRIECCLEGLKIESSGI
jgi:hypothetical protein